VFDAVFREYNVHRARSIDELVDVAYACSGGVFPKTPRVGVVTISGGVGIQMADAAAELGLELPRMPDTAQRQVLAMVPFAGPANPVDATAQVINDWSMFTRILGIVAQEGDVDSVISFLAHTGTTPGVMERLKPALQEVRARLPGPRFHSVHAHAARDGGGIHTNRLSGFRRSDARRLRRWRRWRGWPGICRAASCAGEIKAAPALPAGRSMRPRPSAYCRKPACRLRRERLARTRGEAVARGKRDWIPGRAQDSVGRHQAQGLRRRGLLGLRSARRRRARLRHHDGHSR
jgi:hypothetical protein